jgi:hypothetical protein
MRLSCPWSGLDSLLLSLSHILTKVLFIVVDTSNFRSIEEDLLARTSKGFRKDLETLWHYH